MEIISKNLGIVGDDDNNDKVLTFHISRHKNEHAIVFQSCVNEYINNLIDENILTFDLHADYRDYDCFGHNIGIFNYHIKNGKCVSFDKINIE